MATQSNHPGTTKTNENEPFSLPKFFANLLNLFADLCKGAADKEAEKEDEKNRPAYLTARFFQHFFSGAAFLTEHIVSWIVSPKSILNDLQAVVTFFVDLGQKITDWWNEVTGKKPVHQSEHANTPSVVSEKVSTEMKQVVSPSDQNTKHALQHSTTALLSETFGPYQKSVSQDNNTKTSEQPVKVNVTDIDLTHELEIAPPASTALTRKMTVR